MQPRRKPTRGWEIPGLPLIVARNSCAHRTCRGCQRPDQQRIRRKLDPRHEAGAIASVGSTGNSYGNALAEAFNSLFKAELVRNKGPWTGIDDLEIAVAEYIDWCNHRGLHGETGLVPPAELETEH